MSSHPPTLITLVRRRVRDAQLWARGELICVAVSGGPDSIALLDALARLREKLGHRLVAVGVDHGLRAEAAAELDLAATLADEHGVAFFRRRADVAAGGNLQARARRARHRLLQEVAAETSAHAVALGHTADDRAETILLRILRGTGPGGLAAMPASAPGIEGPIPLVRPMIAARRADVLLHLRRHGRRFAEDPSNADPRFLRVRVRRELLPLLETLSPQIVRHLNELGDAIETDPNDPLASLNRSQRHALQRALQLRQGDASIRLSGGVDLRLSFFPVRADRDDEP